MVVTVESLRNDARKSGFNHVIKSVGPKPFFGRAYGGTLDKAGRSWQGPRREYASSAAQDYCDHVNGATPAPPATLKTAGHAYNIETTPDPEVTAALGVLRDAKAQRAGRQGFVYLIVEDVPTSAAHGLTGVVYGKIGYSVNPNKRVAELQTGNPRKLRLLYKKPGTPADEAALHTKYIRHNVLQEWFRVTKDLVLEFPAEKKKAV